MEITDQLKRDEGLRLHPYRDTVGKLTIGYGRNLDDNGISEQEATTLLVNDIARIQVELSKALPWYSSLDYPRRAVLVNMAYNMGVAKFLRDFPYTLATVGNGDYGKASQLLLNSIWATQVGDRAKRLAKQLESGEWV